MTGPNNNGLSILLVEDSPAQAEKVLDQAEQIYRELNDACGMAETQACEVGQVQRSAALAARGRPARVVRLDDVLRRGRPTVHVAFDEATAILAGDALQVDFREGIPDGWQRPQRTAEIEQAHLVMVAESATLQVTPKPSATAKPCSISSALSPIMWMPTIFSSLPAQTSFIAVRLPSVDKACRMGVNSLV